MRKTRRERERASQLKHHFVHRARSPAPARPFFLAHPQVDMVSFTGSTEVGRHIGALAAQGVKRVALELGGKSPNVLLDDVDVARAVGDGLGRAFLNSGQTCSALTRMLVPRVRLREFEEAAVAAVEAAMKVGDPLGRRHRHRPARIGRAARPRSFVHRGGQRGGREAARRRRQPAQRPAGRLLRRAGRSSRR